jgi:hypothetical protein
MAVLPNFRPFAREPAAQPVTSHAALAAAQAAPAAKVTRSAEDDEKKDDENCKASDKDDDGRNNDEKPSDQSKAAEEPDDEGEEDDEEDESKEGKAARARERKRIRAILTSQIGLEVPELAEHFAFNTTDSPRKAISNMKAQAKLTARLVARAAPAAAVETPARERLRERMQEVQIPAVGSDAPAPRSAPIRTADGAIVATADAIILAGKKRRGEI